jgi:hypothetical protein
VPGNRLEALLMTVFCCTPNRLDYRLANGPWAIPSARKPGSRGGRPTAYVICTGLKTIFPSSVML